MNEADRARVSRPTACRVRGLPACAGRLEKLSYCLPTLDLHGALVYYAALKNHVGFYPPVHGDARLVRALARCANEKGNLRFEVRRPLPARRDDEWVQLERKRRLAELGLGDVVARRAEPGRVGEERVVRRDARTPVVAASFCRARPAARVVDRDKLVEGQIS